MAESSSCDNTLNDSTKALASNSQVPSKDMVKRSGEQKDGLNDRSEFFQSVLNKQRNVYGTEQPLATPWKFWWSRCFGGSFEEYMKNLTEIYTAFTTASFWTVFEGLPPPSMYQHCSSLHVMRDLRKPLWKDKYNIYGGAFRLRVKRKDLDTVWKTVLLATVGEQLASFVAHDDEVCGVSVLTQDNEDVVMIWNTNADAADKAKVFECVKRLLPDTWFISMTYTAHIQDPAFGDRCRLDLCNNWRMSVCPARGKTTMQRSHST